MRRISCKLFLVGLIVLGGGVLLFVALLQSALAADYTDRVTEDNPVAWWRFEGDAKDSSDNGHDGKLVNVITFVDGLPSSGGQAAHFNGIDSLVEIRNRDGLRQETLSIELWFRSTQPFDARFWPGSATLISTATSGPGSQDWLINAASQDNKNEGRLLAETGPKGKPSDLYMTSREGDPLNDGHWHHVVLTRHQSGTAKLFVDGWLHFQGRDSGGSVANDRAINIGGENVHPGGRFLDGDIDEVAIYDKILTRERISAHYEAIAKHLPPRPPRPPRPGAEPVALEPVTPVDPAIAGRTARHWAFQPIRQPTAPVVQQKDWVRNPIDAFVLAHMERAGRKPGAEASHQVLVRRANFDLLGLPPPVEMVESANKTEWSKFVDQLLASPQYGERYARHWLDVVRYADSAGYEIDNFYHHASEYRDYVIRSLNDDKSFDRFIHEQLAADVLAPDDESLRYATGFFTVGPYAEEGGIKRPQLWEYRRLTDAADTTAEAFLGLSYGCARCHDHKYEAITQRDYFALHAILAGTELLKLPVPNSGEKKTAQHFVIANRPNAPVTRLLQRGNYKSPAGAVAPGLPAVFPGSVDFAERSIDDFEQRRARLADWMTLPENPLTARVIANRVWMWHFGWPLVATPNDFGVRSEAPTHPELLDHLANYLRSNDWSLKALHRQIMNSATYRMAHGADFPRRRLEAEAIWDNLLTTAGVLNVKMFGPPVYPPIDQAVIKAKANAKWTTPKKRADWARRGIYVVSKRSMNYPFFETFNVTLPVTSCGRRDRTVDSPQALTLLNEPIVAEIAAAFAGRLLRECQADSDAMIERAWLLAFGRSTSEEELEITRDYLAAAEARLARSPGLGKLPQPEETEIDRVRGAALVIWCLSLFNANEFIYVD